MPGRFLVALAGFTASAVLGLLQAGCISNQLYNETADEYLLTLPRSPESTVGVDLAIIEFDEFGMLWQRSQLEDALELIAQRNKDSERGIMLVTFTHGWMNNADPSREEGDLRRFRDGMLSLASELETEGAPAPDHVIGVYLGWRGATNRVPGWSSLSFWDRKDAAERVASYQMRETLFRLTDAAKQRADSKVLLSGHSMGGMILARTLAPTISTLLLASDPAGIVVPLDLVILQNPALDALAAYQFIEFLKRAAVTPELRHADGTIEHAPGPVLVSITSESDWVTRVAYPAGQIFGNISKNFRADLGTNVPSQGRLANRAHGHLDFLVSHRATLVDGEVVIERVPGAFNTTPFWIVQTTGEICADHGDIYNEHFLDLVEQLAKLNRLYDTSVQTWLRKDVGESNGQPRN
ncbi:MAG: hypothetical protein AAGG07_10340 [Planctomycetota bacterium]